MFIRYIVPTEAFMQTTLDQEHKDKTITYDIWGFNVVQLNMSTSTDKRELSTIQ